MHPQRPFQLLRYVLLVLLFVSAIPALSIPGEGSSNALYDNMIIHDAREAAPDGFVYVSHVPDDKAITLELGLHGNDIPGMVQRLYEISTPGSPSYGKHLSKEEAESYARPANETVYEVNAWLTHHGVQSKVISSSGDRLQVTVPASQANKMFQTTFSTFRYTETGTESFQALTYSLPSQLHNLIASVEPTTSFPNPASRSRAAVRITPSSSNSMDSTCEREITPRCLTQLYRIPTAKATQKNNVLSVLGFREEDANRQDLASFLRDFRPDLHGASFKDEFIDGGQNPQYPGSAGAVANLDIQYTVGLVNFAPVVFLSSELDTINGLINVANYWLNQDHPPTVVSISYGFLESSLSRKSALTLCHLYGLLASRGVSVLVSSGDGDVAGSQPGECIAFRPTFPASCPLVTTVGATGGFPTEHAANLSAGGFSNLFSHPPYQVDAVNRYLRQIGPLYHGLYHRTGRVYPDISAQGDDRKIVMMLNGTKYLVGGTVVSTPIVASTITLLNDRLLRRGRPVLGFLNPWLYANQRALNSITSGSNPSCGTSGFPAKAGWNPVTGLGTPDFLKLAKTLRV